ncbi:MAG: ABC transporter ATP-binding protein [Candidatus Thermoplasmatota archaeon]|nr:ABC transporter ATP-binding protein [Candidatus Thermoplasmatota archaeon]
MNALQAEGLVKRFNGFSAVDGLSFEVQQGEIFGLLGPNGAGKTTTIRMLSCLIAPTSGTATVNGHEIINDPLAVRRSVGILTENPSLYERLTAYENMDFFARAYGITDERTRKDRIKEQLDFFGLWERRNDRAGTFSKGMKQKLAIARALVHDPPVLFMDEPTAGLDPEASKNIRELIEKLSRQEKRTILLSTHHLEDAERLCRRVMIIKKGKSVVVGSPEELQDSMAGKPSVEISMEYVSKAIIDAVKSVEGVGEAFSQGKNGRIVATVENAKSAVPMIVRNAVGAGASILSVSVKRPSLEDAYLKLVKEENEAQENAKEEKQ